MAGRRAAPPEDAGRRAALPGDAGRSIQADRLSTVGASNTVRTGSSTPRTVRTPRGHPGRQQRMASQSKEIFGEPHPFHAEHLGEDPRHQLLDGRARRHPGAGGGRGRRLRTQLREGLPVHLAAGGQGERRQEHPGGRQHGVRQTLAQEAPRRGLVHLRPGLQGDERHQPAALAVALCQHRRFADGGVRQERSLDLPQLDAEAADLHLVVDAPQELDGAVTVEADEIAGAVEAPARGAERVGEEPRRGLVGPAEIAAGEARATDQQLSGHPGRHRLHPAVEHVEPAGREGRPMGTRRAREGASLGGGPPRTVRS